MVKYFYTFAAIVLLIAVDVTADDKARIGLGEITSSIRGSDPYSFQAMLETQIIKTNKFTVIERNRLDEIFKEQGLSSSGLVDGDVEMGMVQGVDYLVYGTITKLGKERSGTRVRGASFGGNNFTMSIDLRIVDTQTGEIRLAETVEQTVEAGKAVSFGGFSNATEKGDPIADVQRLVAKDVTAKIATTIYPAKIIAIQKNGTFVINYGEAIYNKGDLVRVVEVGETFVDEDTGEILGADETEIGLLEIVRADSKISRAQLIDGENVVKGNVVYKLNADETKSAQKAAKKARKKKRKRL